MPRARICLLLVACTACGSERCGATSDEPVPVEPAQPDAGMRKASALPDARPAATTITFGFALGNDRRRSVRLEASAFTRTETVGNRRITVTYDADVPALDEAYATLRTQGFDALRSHVRSSPRDTGTFLQLRAGGLRSVLNDTGKFEPRPASAKAYAACVEALSPLLTAEPGTAVPLAIDVAPEVTERVEVKLDVGPDLRGASWQDGGRARIHLATRRPVEVVARVGRRTERILIDLSRHAGVTIKAGASLTLLEGPAQAVGGEVSVGLDRRTQTR